MLVIGNIVVWEVNNLGGKRKIFKIIVCRVQKGSRMDNKLALHAANLVLFLTL